jgi:hypothetical protein
MRFISIYKLLHGIVVGVSMLVCLPTYAGQPKNSDFLKNSEGERKWYYFGAFDSIGHTVALKDKEKADCIWRYYFDHVEERNVQIEESMTSYPDHAPTAIILALIEKNCGKLE